MNIPAAVHLLPWWGTKTCSTEQGPVSFLVQTDGTCVMGLNVSGRDYSTLDTQLLNNASDFCRDVINQLPQGYFLQITWDTGSLSYADIIDGFEGQCGKLAHPVLAMQRRKRADLFRNDTSLMRGKLVYWVGIKRGIGLAKSKKKRIAPLNEKDFETVAKNLGGLVTRISAQLLDKGVRTGIFNETELIAECYRAANPISSKRLGPPQYDFEKYPLLRLMTLRETLLTGAIVENEESFAIDEPLRLHRALGMQRLPSQTVPNILGALQSKISFPCRVSLTFESTDHEKVHHDITIRRNRMLSQAAGHRRDLAAEVAVAEFEEILGKMLVEDERTFEASLSVIVNASSRPQLDELSSELIHLCSEKEISLVTHQWSQIPTWLSSLPGNGYRAPKKFMLLTRNCADYCLSGRPSEGDRTPDLLYHTRSQGLCKLSIGEDKPSKHALMFGGTGSGKSFHVSMIIENALSQGQHVTIIDVQGPEISSYRRMTELFGGRYYALSDPEQDICLNPFLPHSEMFSENGIDEEQLSFLENLIVMIADPELLKGSDAKFYKSVVRTTVEQAYIMTEGTGRSPIFSDIEAALKEYEGPEEEYAVFARTLYLQLSAWLSNKRHSRLFNRSREFTMNGNFNVFDFFGLKEDEALGGILLLVCSHLVWSQLKKLDRSSNKMVVFDEAWALIQHEAGAELIQSLYRTARKFNGCIFAISQSASDVLNTPVKDAIINNTSTFFLQKHNHGFEDAAAVCSLTKRHSEMLRELEYRQGEYADCLVVDKAKSDAMIVRLKPTSFDLWLNTTNPVDSSFRDHLQKSKKLSFLDAIHELSETHPTGAPKDFQMEAQ